MDRLPPRVLPAGAGSLPPVPAPVPRGAGGPAHGGAAPFFGDLAGLADPAAFAAYLAPLRKAEWVVYAKPPFGGPEAVLAYLSRYTHRVAISNSRLVSADADTVAFRWKDYRIKTGDRQKVMRLETGEFIRRFLIHVLPDGFHRIRHYGLLAGATRKATIARIRTLLGEASPARDRDPQTPGAEIVPLTLREPCPCCGGPMRIVEIFRRGQRPRSRAPSRLRPPTKSTRSLRDTGGCGTPTLATCAQNPPASGRHIPAIPSRNDLHPHRQRAFPIGSAQTPAASSFRDLSTWAATGQPNRHAAAHIEKSSGGVTRWRWRPRRRLRP
jgi:hypothetical protein